MASLVFHLAALLSVAAALLAFHSRRLDRSALLLGAFSLLLAVELLAVGAPFLALAQLLLQAGPIAAIVSCSRGRPRAASPPFPGPQGAREGRWIEGRLLGIGASVLAFAVLTWAVLSSDSVVNPLERDLTVPPSSRAAIEAGGARSIGESLCQGNRNALVAAGALILAAVVGAVRLSGATASRPGDGPRVDGPRPDTAAGPEVPP